MFLFLQKRKRRSHHPHWCSPSYLIRNLKDNKTRTQMDILQQDHQRCWNVSCGADLVDGESNGLHVLSLLPHASAVLLDQTHHQTASRLAIIWVIVLFVQLDHKLWIRPKRVCGSQTNAAGLVPRPLSNRPNSPDGVDITLCHWGKNIMYPCSTNAVITKWWYSFPMVYPYSINLVPRYSPFSTLIIFT